MKRWHKWALLLFVVYQLLFCGGVYHFDVCYYESVDHADKDGEANIFVTVFPKIVENSLPMVYRNQESYGLYEIGCHANFREDRYQAAKAISASLVDQHGRTMQLEVAGEPKSFSRAVFSEVWYSFAIDLAKDQSISGKVEIRVELELITHDGAVVTKQLRRQLTPVRRFRLAPVWYYALQKAQA